MKLCNDFMIGKCRFDNCKFDHNKNACVHFWKHGRCKFGDQCRYEHISNNKKRIRNTICFEPSHKPPEMRVLFEYGKTKYEHEISTDDVIVVPDLFQDISYDDLLKEVPEEVFQLWHGDSHHIANDKHQVDWKANAPLFKEVIDRIANYFDMDVKATRFNWYKDTRFWKPHHQDASAVKPEKAKTQNFTVGVSFGATRDASFESIKGQQVVNFPLKNGYMYSFAKRTNINWRHGIPQLPPEKQTDEGRISIIAWGFVHNLVE